MRAFAKIKLRTCSRLRPAHFQVAADLQRDVTIGLHADSLIELRRVAVLNVEHVARMQHVALFGAKAPSFGA